MTDERISLSVVIPVYREEEILREAVAEISRELKTIGDSYEILLIDDGSPDDTWNVIRELARQHPALRAVRLSRHFGKEPALFAGLERAGGRAVIVMDADLQHPPSLLPKMVEIWKTGESDVVEAVKTDRGSERFVNRIGAGLFYAILNKFTGYDFRGASDFKLLDRKVVDALLAMRERTLFFRGMSAWLGFRRRQIPFEVKDRAGSLSKWTTFQLIRLAVNAVTSFSSLPLYLIMVMGYLFFIFAVLFGGYALFLKISGFALSGFTTVILLLLIIGSLLMISLGIIGEYIARIYEEMKGRPRYIIAETIDTGNLPPKGNT
jgi:glycosyltransferase involved in cell wall biosynthesis